MLKRVSEIGQVGFGNARRWKQKEGEGFEAFRSSIKRARDGRVGSEDSQVGGKAICSIPASFTEVFSKMGEKEWSGSRRRTVMCGVGGVLARVLLSRRPVHAKKKTVSKKN